LPFADNYADEMRAIHIIEHCWPWDAPRIVTEWARVLKPGAKLAIECPDIDKVLSLANVPEIPPAFTFWALYGDPRHKSPEMMHRWCYNRSQVGRIMVDAGLVDVRPGIPQFHHPIRDMRIVGIKPDESRVLPA
jgi:SAM-dependent methyltransferase